MGSEGYEGWDQMVWDGVGWDRIENESAIMGERGVAWEGEGEGSIVGVGRDVV